MWFGKKRCEHCRKVARLREEILSLENALEFQKKINEKGLNRAREQMQLLLAEINTLRLINEKLMEEGKQGDDKRQSTDD